MKKFPKICFIIACVFLVIGLCAITAGSAIGGAKNWKDVKAAYDNTFVGEVTEELEKHNVHIIDFDDSISITSKDSEMNPEEIFIYDAKNIDTLEFDISVGEVIINTDSSATNSITVVAEYDASEAKFYVSNSNSSTLVFKSHTNALSFNGDATLTITVPSGFEFKHVDINQDTGNFSINGPFTISDLTLEVDAADLSFDTITVSQFKCESDIGNIEANNITLLGDFDLEADVGNVSLNLNGSNRDFNYDISSDIGSAIIDGISSHHEHDASSVLGCDYKQNNNSSKTISIETDTGNISINFNN